MKNIYTHNNSIKDEYYKQTNNERDPFIACFPTSLINLTKKKLVDLNNLKMGSIGICTTVLKLKNG